MTSYINQNTQACCAACGSAGATPEAAAIACTLGAGDFEERIASMRDLSARSLVRSRREPLMLSLTYGREALGEVENLVAMESECCAFLDFDLRYDSAGVYLTITAPEAAKGAADDLFVHFAPELAGMHE